MEAARFDVPASIRACAAQCVMMRLGSHLPPVTTAEADAARVRRVLDTTPIGGVLLFRSAGPGIAQTLAELHAASDRPLLVASDIERGVGQQVAGATRFPHARALAETGDPEAAAATLATATAHEARACGIHLAFAPVADVNTCIANPIIGTRAFGDTPDVVSRCVRAYVRAAHNAGLATTAKHFPGHGRTEADSHATLPTVAASPAALRAVDLPPFQAAIDAGVDAIMTAHVAYPTLGANGPATASRALLHDRLRTQMGFGGLVVSDSLRMEGIREASPAALLAAGVDLLLDPADAVATVNALVTAVRDGRLSEDRLRAACRRVLALKRTMHRRWGDAAFAPPGLSGAAPSDPSVDAQDAANRLAREALAVTVRTPGCWPLPPDDVRDGADLMVVRFTPHDETDAAPDAWHTGTTALEQALHAAYPSVTYRTVDATTSDAERDALRILSDGFAHLVVVVAVEPAAWQRFDLRPEQHALVRTWIEQRPVVLVALGSPHGLPSSPSAAATACTYSGVPASQRALIYAMTGRSKT